METAVGLHQACVLPVTVPLGLSSEVGTDVTAENPSNTANGPFPQARLWLQLQYSSLADGPGAVH